MSIKNSLSLCPGTRTNIRWSTANASSSGGAISPLRFSQRRLLHNCVVLAILKRFVLNLKAFFIELSVFVMNLRRCIEFAASPLLLLLSWPTLIRGNMFFFQNLGHASSSRSGEADPRSLSSGRLVCGCGSAERLTRGMRMFHLWRDKWTALSGPLSGHLLSSQGTVMSNMRRACAVLALVVPFKLAPLRSEAVVNERTISLFPGR